jgi:pyrimidine-nucleoside phosphorylase
MMKKSNSTNNKDSDVPFTQLIEKKCDGAEFTQDEIRKLVEGVLDGVIPDYQLSALCMAIKFKGMSAQELSALAEEMMLSGTVIDLETVTKPKIDKYSTGGVGDKTTMVLPALTAACGVVMPTMCGVDDEMGISTIEKMMAIPGFKAELSDAQFIKQVSTIRCAIGRQSEQIAPVDATLYKLRQETGSGSSLHLMTASILSRKMAEGVEGLVVDVKWGNGAYVKTLEEAKQLARSVTRVARGMNRRSVALVTDMNQPLGDSVGTALEVKEAIELLKGRGPEDLKDLILKMGMEIVRLAGVAGSTLSAKQTVERALQSGAALESFKAMVKAQGGDVACIDDPEKFKKATFTKKLPAPKRGYVHTIDAKLIVEGVRALSGGGTKLDPAVGITNIMKVGAQIKQGEPLMTIHYNDESNLADALELFREAYRLAPKRPNPGELVVERVA